ncbi:hypothetical protein D3C87_2051410 [compost metagenome]
MTSTTTTSTADNSTTASGIAPTNGKSAVSQGIKVISPINACFTSKWAFPTLVAISTTPSANMVVNTIPIEASCWTPRP